MKSLSTTALALVVLVACADPEPSSRGPNGDSANAGHGPDAGMMHHDASEMRPQIEPMNEMMVGQLGPADAQYDLRFIDLMIPHHEGALAMARSVTNGPVRPEIRDLAGQIISDQEREIAQMREWRNKWYGDTARASVAGHEQMMGESHRMDSMMTGMLRTGDSAAGRMFLEMMIPHHEGAIAMAEDAVGKTQRAELRKLAETIITSQRAEIARMEQLLGQEK